MGAAAVPLKEPKAAVEPRVGGGGPSDLLRLAGKGVALALGVIMVIFAIVIFVPDGNDYGLATLKKHARLAADVPRKIVFVGGSNLAFGLDSPAIERATGTHVVNMGMNGFFGPRYLLEEVKASMRRPDVVAISFEYDGFYKPIDGTPSELFMVCKANPSAAAYLTWSQRAEVAQAAPYVAQQKILKLLREGIDWARRGGRSSEGGSVSAAQERLLNFVGSLSGFNEQGDLTSHLGVDWPYERGAELNISERPVDPEVVGLLQQFTREMQERGVTVFISYTPAEQSYYDRHQRALDDLHALLLRSGLVVPRPPSDFVFREAWFFDTVFHLTAEGRVVRTQKVIDDLEQLRKSAGVQ